MLEKHEFGGSWTEEKLKMVEKYLQAYAVIMNNYRFAYIDAFAGTGYREEKDNIEEIDIYPGFNGTPEGRFTQVIPDLGLTLDPPIDQKIIEDNTISVIYL